MAVHFLGQNIQMTRNVWWQKFQKNHKFFVGDFVPKILASVIIIVIDIVPLGMDCEEDKPDSRPMPYLNTHWSHHPLKHQVFKSWDFFW